MPIQVNTTTAVRYPKPRQREKYNTQNLIGQNDKKEYNGYLSESAKKKIRNLVTNAANALLYTQADGEEYDYIKYRELEGLSKEQKRVETAIIQNIVESRKKNLKKTIAMITLTLPSKQILTDKEIKRMALMPFIEKMKYVCGIKLWLWVAETQKNGNIHFHIIIDEYIPFVVFDINKTVLFAGTIAQCQKYMQKRDKQKNLRMANYAEFIWNKLLNKIGQMDDFKAKYRHTNPPSTKIEWIRNQEKAGAYISKYISKNDKTGRKIDGRLWGASDQLKQLKGIEIEQDDVKEVLKELHENATVIFENEYVTAWGFNIMDCPSIHGIVMTKYSEILTRVYKDT